MPTSVIERPVDLPAEGPSRADVFHASVRRGTLTILDLLDQMPWFRRAATWKAWRAFLAATYSLPMDREELAIFQECCQRNRPPARKVDEAWMIVGRRGRKSAVGALIGIFEGGCRDHRPHLAKGEIGRVLITSNDKDNAQAIYQFQTAILSEPSLSHLVVGESTMEETLLTTGIELKIRAASTTGGRSKAIVCALLDEIAFFPTRDSSTPDTEILRGIRPAMANIPGALLVCMSSPYAERGELYDAYDKHFGKEQDERLVWRASTLQMHDTPAIRLYVEKEWKNDPVSAAAEVGPTPEMVAAATDGPKVIAFRKDVQVFVRREVVRAVTMEGRYELQPYNDTPPQYGEHGPRPARFNYHAFVDTSGGSSDSFALAIAHWDPTAGKDPLPGQPQVPRGRAVLDLIRKWDAPFSPKDVTKAACDDIKRFRLNSVMGDAYAGEWPRERFSDEGVGYDVSPLVKRELYRDVLPALNSLVVELLDNEELKDQLIALERRVTAMGQEVIDHPKGGHDDVANAVAGALLLAYQEGQHMAPPKEQEVLPTTEAIWAREFERLQDQVSRDDEARDDWHDRWQQ